MGQMADASIYPVLRVSVINRLGVGENHLFMINRYHLRFINNVIGSFDTSFNTENNVRRQA